MTEINCFKYSTYIVNIFVFLEGLASLAVGIRLAILAQSSTTTFQAKILGVKIAEFEIAYDVSSVFYAIYSVAIAIGLILMLTGFVGCCGTLNENRRLLAIYGFSLLTFFVVKVICGFLLWHSYPEIRKILQQSICFYHKYHSSAEGQAIYEGWQMFQNALNCCGVTGLVDWTNVIDPPSPCLHLSPPEGCEEVLKKYIWLIVGIVCIILFLELIAMMFAVSCLRSKRRVTSKW